MSSTSTQAEAEQAASVDLITPRTIAQFLFCDADAIRMLANNRSTIWLGLLFVMSAAIAREYDGEDLLYEPWYLLIPFAASLVTSFLLYIVITLLAWRHNVRSQYLSYRSFLGLYWMTAPLAWLYGIPVERLGSEETAVQLNILFLAVVAFWRVILIIRVIAVLYGANLEDVTPVVLLFADSVMLTMLAYFPIPVLSFMGGIKSNPAESMIAMTTIFARLAGYFSFVIWLLGTMIAFVLSAPWHPTNVTPTRPTEIARSVWSLAVLAIVGWCSLLPMTQPEQQLRRQVEQLFRSGDLKAAVALMSGHRQRDFPPFWDPPPRIAYPNQKVGFSVADVLDLTIGESADWVHRIYLKKLSRQLYSHHFEWSELCRMSDSDRMKVLSVLERLPERQEFLKSEEIEPLLRRLALDEELSVSTEVREKARLLIRQENQPDDDNVKL